MDSVQRRVLADYSQVRAKASQIYQNGGVTPLSLSPSYCQFKVRSTSGQEYLSLIEFPDDGSGKMVAWDCSCPWQTYQVGGRDSKYKHLEGRKCSHLLACTYYLMAFRSIVTSMVA